MNAQALKLRWWIFESMAIGSWGWYGLMLAISAIEFGHSRMMALLLVCAAYLVCTLPSTIRSWKETGLFTGKGVLWGIAAGISGFGGAACLAQALSQGKGLVLLVMPLVFAGAPCVNAFYSILLHRILEGKWVKPTWKFWCGVFMIAFSAYWVLAKRPMPPSLKLEVEGNIWFYWTCGTMFFFGTYGPNNLLSLTAMGRSPARSLVVICLTYGFCGMLATPFFYEAARLTEKGLYVGLFAGLLGYLGAVGVAYANKTGMQMEPKRRPILNMPVIFGGASFMSVVAALSYHPPGDWSFMWLFSALLALLVAGMVCCIRYNPAH